MVSLMMSSLMTRKVRKELVSELLKGRYLAPFFSYTHPLLRYNEQYIKWLKKVRRQKMTLMIQDLYFPYSREIIFLKQWKLMTILQYCILITVMPL